MSDNLKPGEPVRLAIFRSIGTSHAHLTTGQKWLEKCDYARISEYAEVTFPPLQDDAQIIEMVRALDNHREQTVCEFTRKLAEIDRQKAELLAITYQPEIA